MHIGLSLDKRTVHPHEGHMLAYVEAHARQIPAAVSTGFMIEPGAITLTEGK